MAIHKQKYPVHMNVSSVWYHYLMAIHKTVVSSYVNLSSVWYHYLMAIHKGLDDLPCVPTVFGIII